MFNCPTSFTEKKHSPLTDLPRNLGHKSRYHICEDSFWTLLSVPSVYLSILAPLPDCLNYYSVLVNLQIR